MSPFARTKNSTLAPSQSAPPNSDYISVKGVSKIYGTREGKLLALDNVDFSVGRGDFVAVLGPSGCGKSTLMLMIAGLQPYTTGKIYIDGQKIDRAYTNLGIVFQDAVLLDWRRVIDNLLIQAEVRKLDKQASRLRARQLLAMVGLERFEGKYPYELSGGMRQRVSICRALLHDPSLLLMDEPFGALDALTRDQLNLDLQQIWMETRKTVMFITHSITEAVFLADRVVVMTPHPGRVGAVVEVDLPRPRSLDARETPQFGRCTQEIRSLFESWGVLRNTVQTRAV